MCGSEVIKDMLFLKVLELQSLLQMRAQNTGNLVHGLIFVTVSQRNFF